MTEGAISREAMLASLGDIRLPAEAAGGMIAEFAAVVGLAALAALIVVALLRGAGIKRISPGKPTIAERHARIRALPEDRRRIALLHLLKELAPDRHAALGDRLYRPGGVPLDEIEAEVARHA